MSRVPSESFETVPNRFRAEQLKKVLSNSSGADKPDALARPAGGNLVSFQSIRSRKCNQRFRFNPYQPGFARKNPELVTRRSNQAGDHQLPHVQTGARWFVLRPYLRPGH